MKQRLIFKMAAAVSFVFIILQARMMLDPAWGRGVRRRRRAKKLHWQSRQQRNETISKLRPKQAL
jgi:hypothetical protein